VNSEDPATSTPHQNGILPDTAVVMAIYQNDKLEYVRKSVQSILSQTYPHFDYFICFDGPVSYEVKRFILSLTDSRLKLFQIEEHGGLAKALNFMLERVLEKPQYELIARMDADDISVSNRFEIQKKFFLENPLISCVGSWYKEIDENENIISYQRLPLKHEELRRYFLRRSPLAHPSVMFRRSLIEKIGMYPTNTLRLEDYVFWSNGFRNGLLFENLPEYLLLFRRDRNFYRRRSGILFGFRYIITRFKINKTLQAPFYIYFYSFAVGIVRMMPSFILNLIYNFVRKSNALVF
jgi:glycosyltransferase involved in cell wall biosynthesis